MNKWQLYECLKRYGLWLCKDVLETGLNPDQYVSICKQAEIEAEKFISERDHYEKD